MVLPGLQEIGAGVFEGTADRGALGLLGYGAPQLAWTFGLRSVPILGGTIATWVMMNVDNPDPLLILTHPLGNTDAVVVTGSPDSGWTLTNWADIAVNPHPSLLTAVFVVVRNLITLPQTIAYQIGQVFAPPPLPSTTTNQPVPSPMSGVTVASRSPVAADPVVRAVTAEHPAEAETAKKDVAGSQHPVTDTDQPAVHTSAKKPSGATDLTDDNKVSPLGTPAAGDVTGTKDPAAPTVVATTDESPGSPPPTPRPTTRRAPRPRRPPDP